MDIFEFAFMQRAFVAGIIVAIICPLIGIFLVVRRQSLIGDGLGHMAFAGACAGWLFSMQPVFSAAAFTVVSACIIEKMRSLRADFADMLLAIFFYCGMALAVVLASMQTGFGMVLSSFLFGSIVTVNNTDLLVAFVLGVVIVLFVFLNYQKLVYIAFDEQDARVCGLSVDRLNFLLAILTALTVALSMRIVGILLVSAMLVLPTACALVFERGFKQTLILALAFSLFSMICGLVASYYLNLAPGGVIVLLSGFLFFICQSISFFKKGFSAFVAK